jgi:hypothetical protein
MTVSLMRSSSADAIDKCTAALAVAFQRHIDVATMRIYRETLSDLPQWAIEAAALQLRRTGGEFFPPAPTWHQVAEELIAARTRETLQLSAPSRRPYEHPECRDNGWLEVDRDGKVVCVPCSCRATNSNYRRLTASSRKK